MSVADGTDPGDDEERRRHERAAALLAILDLGDWSAGLVAARDRRETWQRRTGPVARAGF